MIRSDYEIRRDSPTAPDVLALLERHWAFTVEHSPEGACYTFTADELGEHDVLFWTARRNGQVVGCVALKDRSETFAELKSLHVLSSERGQGLGDALVQTVIEAARSQGKTRLGLETGNSEGFGPSRRLYERAGFRHGPVFPPYVEASFSYCMTMAL